MGFKIIWEYPALSIVLIINATLFLLFAGLLCTTLYRQRLVMHAATYLVGAALGVTACLAFSWLGARALPTFRPWEPSLGSLIWVLLPSALMIEAGVLGVLGSRGMWRLPFLIPTGLGATVFVRLLIRILANS